MPRHRRPHGELAATRIDEVKPPAAGKLVALDDGRARRGHRALARDEVVGVDDDEWAAGRRRRL